MNFGIAALLLVRWMLPAEIAEGIACHGTGSVVLAERGGARVRLIDLDATYAARIATPDRLPADEGLFRSTELSQPVDVTSDGSHVWVLDRFEKLVVATGVGAEQLVNQSSVGLPGVGDPEAIAVTAGGDLLILDAGDNCIRVVRDGVLTDRRIGAFGRGRDGMSCPHDMELGADGVIYVADSGNRRIQRYRLSDGACLGPWGSHGEGPGQFIDPTGVALNARGELLVADHYAHRIQVFDTTTGQEILERRLDLPEEIRYPTRIAALPDGRCVVTCPQPSEVWVLTCP